MASTGRRPKVPKSTASTATKDKRLSGPPLDIPVQQISLGQRLLHFLEQNKEKIHQVDATTGVTETKGAVKSRAIELAFEMQSKGIHPGDIVVLCSKCHADFTISLLACLAVGAVISPMSNDLTADEVYDRMYTLRPKMIFCDIRMASQIDRAIKKLKDSLSCLFVLYGNEKKSDTLSFNNLVSGKPIPKFTPYEVVDSKQKISFIFPTQGTTGAIKLCACSEYAALTRQEFWISMLKGCNKILSYLPVNWSEQILLICSTFELPVTRILGGSFQERICSKLLHDLQVDTFILSTDFITRMIHHTAILDYSMACVKNIIFGGLVMSPTKTKKFAQFFSEANLYNLYGLAEAGWVSKCNVADINFKSESIGQLLPGVLIRIEDLNTREILGSGVQGELLVGGPSVMAGYAISSSKTDFLKRGFVRTGDIASYDDEGFLNIMGRTNDLVYIEDSRFLAVHLEDVVMRHASVREAAVLGNRKEVALCVVKKTDHQLTREAMLQYLRNNHVPDYQMPSRIQFLDTFPKTSIGMVKKHILMRNLYAYDVEKSITSFEDFQ